MIYITKINFSDTIEKCYKKQWDQLYDVITNNKENLELNFTSLIIKYGNTINIYGYDEYDDMYNSFKVLYDKNMRLYFKNITTIIILD